MVYRQKTVPDAEAGIKDRFAIAGVAIAGAAAGAWEPIPAGSGVKSMAPSAAVSIEERDDSLSVSLMATAGSISTQRR